MFAAAALVLSAAACQVEVPASFPQDASNMFTAGFSAGKSVAMGGVQTFKAGEIIDLLDNEAKTITSITLTAENISADGKTATFHADIDGQKDIIAVYPGGYAAKTTWNIKTDTEGNVTSVDDKPHFAALNSKRDGFATAVCPGGAPRNIKFTNVVSCVTFSSSETVSATNKWAALEGLNGEKFPSQIFVDPQTGEATPYTTGALDYAFTNLAADNSDDIRLWVLPTIELSQGFSLRIGTNATAAKAVKTIEVNKPLVIGPGEFIRLGDIDKKPIEEGKLVAKKVLYLKNSADIFDRDNSVLTTFNQYALVFDSAEGEVTMVVNVDTQDDFLAGVPTGTYSIDASGEREPDTFSIQSLDGTEKYFTSVGDFVIVDGEIEIADDSVYAILVDEDGDYHEYTFEGQLPAVEDASLALQIGKASCAEDYDTHFTTKANKWNLHFYVSNKIAEDLPYFYSFELTFFSAAGAVDFNSLPAGTYTIDENGAVTDDNLSYKNGIRVVSAGTCDMSEYNYADYDMDEGTYRYCNITGGSFTIIKNADGTYSFDFNLNVHSYYYDWDEYVEVDPVDFTFAHRFNRVALPEVVNDHGAILDDEDYTFTKPFGQYTGMWYGDSYSLGGNVFFFGFTNAEDHYLSFTLNSSSEFTFTKDMRDRYCTKPVPDGTYTFSATPALDCICNLKNQAIRNSIKNNYTGTVFNISGGTITIAGSQLSFDLKAVNGDKEVNFTCAGAQHSVYYFQDYSAAARQAQVAWVE